jgi:hypothetical protein
MAVRLDAFAEALDAFRYLVSLDMDALAKTLDARLVDGLENGKAQKLEYTIELCWKALKQALRERAAIGDGIAQAGHQGLVPRRAARRGLAPHSDAVTLSWHAQCTRAVACRSSTTSTISWEMT